MLTEAAKQPSEIYPMTQKFTETVRRNGEYTKGIRERNRKTYKTQRNYKRIKLLAEHKRVLLEPADDRKPLGSKQQ